MLDGLWQMMRSFRSASTSADNFIAGSRVRTSGPRGTPRIAHGEKTSSILLGVTGANNDHVIDAAI